MKLTPDVVARAPQSFNPIGERQIVLRGLKITAIDSFGPTAEHFDVLDLTDNELRKLENLPVTARLGTLLLSNNRVYRIGADLAKATPNLHTLVLNNNLLADLSDLQPLAALKSLRTLSLLDNPCSRQAHYRAYVVHLLPHLRILDFRKIKMQEREAVRKMFSGAAGKSLKEEIRAQSASVHSSTAAGEDAAAARLASRPGLTAEEAERIQASIRSASSLDEVARLERILRAGGVPDAPAVNGSGTAQHNGASDDVEMDEA